MNLTIDGKQIEVAAGSTILAAAREAGVEIPTLCHWEGVPSFTSCQVCLVRDLTTGRLLPSCSFPAAEGMRIDASSEDVRSQRRRMLELLVSEHVGDCEGPCRRACPAHMDIPEMERRIAAGDWAGAVGVVTEHIPLPSILGRVCPAPCEKACRRGKLDTALPICEQKRQVGDYNLARTPPLLPACKPDIGKRVAIVGSGSSGLSAAYYLRREGFGVTVFDLQAMAGGALLQEISEAKLPRDVIRAEAALIAQMGVDFRFGTAVVSADFAETDAGLKTVSVEQLMIDFDAVLLAVGGQRQDAPHAQFTSPMVTVEGDRKTCETSRPGLFRCGDSRPSKLAVAAVANGRRAAHAIHHWLTTGAAAALPVRFDSIVRELDAQELAQFLDIAPVGAASPSQPAETDAGRCLHCDCGKTGDCRLRALCDDYGLARHAVARDDRQGIVIRREHGQVVYEPGKCIKCGLCVRITAQTGEELGLSFIGRGFDIRVDGALNSSLADALRHSAQACIDACPTGALVAQVPESA